MLRPPSLDSISLSKAQTQAEFITMYFGIIPSWEHLHFNRGLNRKGIIKAYYAVGGFLICVALSSLLSNSELGHLSQLYR